MYDGINFIGGNQKINKQKKSLCRYYTIILLIILALNFFVIPSVTNATIKNTNYSTFLNKIEQKAIDTVQIEENDIYYTLKKDDKKTYKTGVMNDADLVNRLDKSGAKFGQVYKQEMNPMLSYLISFFLPVMK